MTSIFDPHLPIFTPFITKALVLSLENSYPLILKTLTSSMDNPLPDFQIVISAIGVIFHFKYGEVEHDLSTSFH